MSAVLKFLAACTVPCQPRFIERSYTRQFAKNELPVRLTQMVLQRQIDNIYKPGKAEFQVLKKILTLMTRLFEMQDR